MKEAHEHADGALWLDPHIAYTSVGETVWWVCALDDALKRLSARSISKRGAISG
jgi:hypothetical protein